MDLKGLLNSRSQSGNSAESVPSDNDNKNKVDGEAVVMGMGVPVEDPEFLATLRSRLHALLHLTRNPDM